MKTSQRTPYRSILPFRYVDRHHFFGREASVQEMFAKILLYRLVVLFGESGAGKSSLVNAGVIPALQGEGLNVERIRLRPIPEEPILIERIAAAEDPAAGYLQSIFADHQSGPEVPRSLEAFLEAVTRKAAQARCVLIFDQFEEIFTLFERKLGPTALDLQHSLLDAILCLVKNDLLRVKIVINIRDDYLGKLEVLAKKYPQILDHRVRVTYFSTNEARQAILGPFEDDNPFPSRLTGDLADLIVKALAEQTSGHLIVPTQVQIVCARLWESYAGKRAEIGKREYDRERRVSGILEGYFQSELDKIEPRDQRAVAVMILGALVTDAGTRDVVSQDRIVDVVVERSVKDELVISVLRALEDRKIINGTPQRETYFYEVASEYLVAPIKRERQKLEFAEKEREWEQKQLRRLRRLVEGVLVVVLSAGLLLGWRQFVVLRNARRDTVVYLLSSKAALNAESPGSGLQTGLLLAAEAINRRPSLKEAQTVLLTALSLLPQPLKPPTHYASQVAIGANGLWLAYVGKDGALHLSALGGKDVQRQWAKPPDGVRSFVFARRADVLAGEGEDGRLFVHDPMTGREITSFDCRGMERTVSVSGSGRVIAALCDSWLQIWRSGRSWSQSRELPVKVPRGEWTKIALDDAGENVALSGPLASGSRIDVWNLGSKRQFYIDRPGRVTVVAFVRSFGSFGPMIAVGDDAGELALWALPEVSEWTNLRSFAISPVRSLRSLRQPAAVTVLSVSEDDRYIVVGYGDGLARVWDPQNDKEVARLIADGPVRSAAVCSKADQAFVVGRTPELRAWNLAVLHNSIALNARSWKPEDLVREACHRVDHNLTRPEWKSNVPGEPYSKACPELP